jgi:hypothetical protein
MVLVASLASVGIASAGPETVTVANTSRVAVTSKTVLVATHAYELVARGTVSDWCSDTSCQPGDADTGPQPYVGQDALYCYAKWRCPTVELSRQLLVNGQGLDQLARQAGRIAYSASHVYRVKVTGIEGALTFISAAVDFLKFNNSGKWTISITDLGAVATSTTVPKKPAKVSSATASTDLANPQGQWATAKSVEIGIVGKQVQVLKCTESACGVSNGLTFGHKSFALDVISAKARGLGPSTTVAGVRRHQLFQLTLCVKDYSQGGQRRPLQVKWYTRRPATANDRGQPYASVPRVGRVFDGNGC